MSTFIKTFLLASIFMYGFSDVQAQTILKNSNNQLIGYVESNSIFKDVNSNLILDFTVDGQIKSFDGDLIVTFNRSNGLFTDNYTGANLLTIDSTLSIYNSQNINIGKIEASNGQIKDASNNVIGYSVGVDPFYLAYYFFIYLNN